MYRYFLRASALVLATVTPALASAHEVYVLSPGQVTSALHAQPFNMLATIIGDLNQFIFWAFAAGLTIFVVFFVSIIRPLEKALDPWLQSLRKYAAPVARVTIGLSFLAAAYYQATYGPELPITATFGAFSGLVTATLVVIGILISAGLYVRLSALVALALFAVATWHHGIYMLTYTNYFGEIILLLMLGAHHGATPHEAFRRAHALSTGVGRWFRTLARRFAPYSFFVLRVCFGVSLFYASLYAKIMHNQLALMVADLPLGHAHTLAYVFGFEPHFLVLGAGLVEILIASFFILGIEIRFTSLFLLFWLSLSLWYFGEVVWPHIILIGIPIAFIFYGYDKYSLEGWLMKRGSREPVL